MAEADPKPPVAQAPNVDDRARALLDALWNDGSVGAKVRAKAKELFSDVVLPEDHMAPIVAPLREELDEMKANYAKLVEERETERKEAAEASQRLNLESAINGARSKYNLTDDGFNQMVERMKTTGNYTDADAAAAWVVQQTPQSTSVPKADWLPSKLNFLGTSELNENPDFKLLHTNPEGYLDSELQKFVSNPDGYTAETFGQAA